MGPILTPIGADLSVPPERIALFITAYSLPLALMAPILGSVSDRYGRLVVLVPSTLVFGLASIATSFVPTFETGIATRILTGVASGGMLGIAMAMAGDLGEKVAPKAIAFVTSGLTLGIILSPGIGALSAEFWSWRFAFTALGGLALIVVLVGLPSLRTTLAPEHRANANAGKVTEPLFVQGAWGSLIAMAAGLGGAVGCFTLVGERLRSLRMGHGDGRHGLCCFRHPHTGRQLHHAAGIGPRRQWPRPDADHAGLRAGCNCRHLCL
ncbi:MFS transporter [Ochrobactrum grignonense]|nr:MFS transporter [Brucella grignonensis]